MLLVGFFTTLLALGLFRKAEPLFAYFSPNTNRSKAASKIAPREIAALALDLRTAWDVVAYNAYPQDEDSRNSINFHLRQYALIHNANSVTLTNPLAVQFLDAMAEATDIPHTPGETTFDLTPFKNLYS